MPEFMASKMTVLVLDGFSIPPNHSLYQQTKPFSHTLYSTGIVYFKSTQYKLEDVLFFLHHTYLSVSIFNADIHGDHDENGNGDSEISNQTTDLVSQRADNTVWRKSVSI